MPPRSKIFCKSLILRNFVEVVGCKGPVAQVSFMLVKSAAELVTFMAYLLVSKH